MGHLEGRCVVEEGGHGLTIGSFPPSFQFQNSDQKSCHGRVKIPDKSFISMML